MASGVFDKAREGYLGGDLAWDTDDMRAILGDSADYTVDLATHQFLSSVAAGARVAVSGSLSGKTITAGVADATDVVWSLVSGDPCEHITLYKHTGVDATSPLVAYIDGILVTPNGGNITAVWDAGANRIFKL